MKIVPLADAKTHLSKYIDYVTANQELVVITKYGRPTALLVPVEGQEDLERQLLARSPSLRRRVSEMMSEYRTGGALPEKQFWVLAATEDENPPDQDK